MTRTLRVGLTQWHATSDVEANLATAVRLVDEAASAGVDLVLLPENGLMLGSNATMRQRAFTEDAPEMTTLAKTAADNGVTVVLGGMKNATPDGVFNSALVFGPDGQIAGRYDKIHLFDARVNGQSFEASSVEQAGSRPVLLKVAGATVGMTICYDVRFPELYRALAQAGAEVILVPAAFTHHTGQAHWHTLLGARAIENGCFVVASATIRGKDEQERAADAFETYGHALAVGPWGETLADLGEEAPVVRVVELELDQVSRARQRLPVLRQAKSEAYAATPATITVTDVKGD